MACREPFSCLPRSAASDTAVGATATVSEAKLTSTGCQALRYTPDTLRVCVWVVRAGGGERREKSGWRLFWVTARLSNILKVYPAFFGFLIESHLTDVWGGPQVSKENKIPILCYLLSSHTFSLCALAFLHCSVCLQCVVQGAQKPSLPQSWWCVRGPLCSTCAVSPAAFVPAACRQEIAAFSGRDSYYVPERATTNVWPVLALLKQVQKLYAFMLLFDL